MWYLTWAIGLGLMCAVTVLAGVWYELKSERKA